MSLPFLGTEYEQRFTSRLRRMNHTCTTCPNKIEGMADFKDDLSRREYAISGLCQPCQDAVFTPPPDEE